MTIAIDFDKTLTRDEELWTAFIVMGRKRGHEFVIVTGRSNDGEFGREVMRVAERIEIPVVFAGMRWKREAALKCGWFPDVWIDDMPEYIGPQELLLSGPKIEASAKVE